MAIDFPSSPFLGQIVLAGSIYYAWDGVAWNIAGNTLSRMNFIDYVLTSNGTWTKPAGLTKLDVTLVAGGGGSGSCAATGAGTCSAGGGGGGGGTVIACYSDVSILSTVNYTVGTGGAGGVAGTGGTGVDTTFKLLTAAGGAGGTHGAAVGSISSAAGGTGGAGTNTEPASCVAKIIAGGRGEQGISALTVTSVASGGGGGESLFCTRDGMNYLLGAGGYAGVTGHVPGGGGFGAGNSVSQGARNGGAGGAGVIYMREWY